MSKAAVVYWSGTGNTEAMAEEVANGAKAAGAEVESFTTDDFAADKMDDYDAVAFGCPAMGDEVLEEDEFEPLFEDCKAKLSGKKIALFGSYGWGDGEWMRDWMSRMEEYGCDVIFDGLIIREALEDDCTECLELGKKIAGMLVKSSN